jgi:hypothetical protein
MAGTTEGLTPLSSEQRRTVDAYWPTKSNASRTLRIRGFTPSPKMLLTFRPFFDLPNRASDRRIVSLPNWKDPNPSLVPSS